MGGEADGVSWTRELMTYRLYDDDCGCVHVSMLSLLGGHVSGSVLQSLGSLLMLSPLDNSIVWVHGNRKLNCVQDVCL
jgi:hypothetical protein